MNDIIQEIRSGSKEAVKNVYQQYAKDVYNFAKSITGDHDSALAATKKTFVKLFNNIQNGEEPDNIRTAALKIAYDEAYALAAPAEAEPAPDAQPENEPVYAEPMFKRREAAPVDDDIEEEYDEPYEEEDDDFVPPKRKNAQPEDGIYKPKGYDTMKIDAALAAAAGDADEEEYQEEYTEDIDDDIDDIEYEEVPVRKGRVKAADVDVYDLDEEDEYEDLDDASDAKPRNKGLFIFCVVLNVILIIILLWFLAGLLVNLGILPEMDLGYSWFNSHIYSLF